MVKKGYVGHNSVLRYLFLMSSSHIFILLEGFGTVWFCDKICILEPDPYCWWKFFFCVLRDSSHGNGHQTLSPHDTCEWQKKYITFIILNKTTKHFYMNPVFPSDLKHCKFSNEYVWHWSNLETVYLWFKLRRCLLNIWTVLNIITVSLPL